MFLVCWMFLSWKGIEFYQIGFLLYQLKIRGIVHHSVSTLYYIGWFLNVEPFLHAKNKSHLVMVHNLFVEFGLIVFHWGFLHQYPSLIIFYCFSILYLFYFCCNLYYLFFLLPLGLVCYFSSFLHCKFRLLIWDLSSFIMKVFTTFLLALLFLYSITFGITFFWLSFIIRYFLISLVISSLTHTDCSRMCCLICTYLWIFPFSSY